MPPKRKATTTKPAPKRAKIIPPRLASKEQPQLGWRTKKFGYQPVFEIETFFRANVDTRWAVEELERRGLSGLFRPSELVYPRLVRLFYQNLTVESKGSAVLQTHIDGMGISITCEDIAQALNCTIDPPSRSTYTLPPREYRPVEIIEDMCRGRFAKDSRTSTRRSHLPTRLLLIDSILKHNVCVRGQKDERSQSFLSTLYSMEQGYWVNVPQLIWQNMHTIYMKLTETPSQNASSWVLPYPQLVITLLRQAPGFEFPCDETADSIAPPIYGEFNWTMTILHRTHVDDIVAPESPPPLALPPAPTAPTEHSDLRAEFEELRVTVTALRGEVASLKADLTAFRGQHEQDMALLRTFITRVPLVQHPPEQ